MTTQPSLLVSRAIPFVPLKLWNSSATRTEVHLAYRSPAVDRVVSLFELLAGSPKGLTLSEVSRKLNIPKSTTHYLIYTLVSRGYVQPGSDGRHYSLGLRCADLASTTPTELNLRASFTPCLRQIAARVGLTATVAVLKDAQAVIICKAVFFPDVGAGAWFGRHIDLNCTAHGKALIATLPDEKLSKLFAFCGLPQFTPRTISSIAALKANLAEVRANGFAVNDEEQVNGIRAVAVPIVDRAGTVVASVAVRGTSHQIPRSRLPELGGELIRMSHEMSL